MPLNHGILNRLLFLFFAPGFEAIGRSSGGDRIGDVNCVGKGMDLPGRQAANSGAESKMLFYSADIAKEDDIRFSRIASSGEDLLLGGTAAGLSGPTYVSRLKVFETGRRARIRVPESGRSVARCSGRMPIQAQEKAPIMALATGCRPDILPKTTVFPYAGAVQRLFLDLKWEYMASEART